MRTADVDDAIAANAEYAGDDLFERVRIKREERVLKMIKQDDKKIWKRE